MMNKKPRPHFLDQPMHNLTPINTSYTQTPLTRSESDGEDATFLLIVYLKVFHLQDKNMK